jgi:proteic killer suppression protein
LGDAATRKLTGRLADLKAARSVADMVAGRPRIMRRNGAEVVVIDLGEGYSLMFKANHSTVPTKGATGAVDWAAVKRIKITCIEA